MLKFFSSFRHSAFTLDPINPVSFNFNTLLVLKLTIPILPVIFPLSFPNPSISIVVLPITAFPPILEPTYIFGLFLNVLNFTIIPFQLTVLEVTFVDALLACVWLDYVHYAEAFDAIVKE